MLRAPSRLALAANSSKPLRWLVPLAFSTGFVFGCTSSRGPSEIDKELARAKRDATKRKPAECYPESKEPCYTGADGAQGPEGTAGRGICKEGLRQCDKDGFWQACEGSVIPGKELCNDIDDDCNGKVDDGFERAGTKCFAGEGECRVEGKVSCSADLGSSTCSAAAKDPSAEVCDGKDNDCDGTVDDGDVEGTGAECKTSQPGACNAGIKQCVAGSIKCMAVHTRTVELCINKIDDNCDGKTDEVGCLDEKEARAQGIIK
ncbi:MopE-related protein [Nannocystaceae bacterium ST9]